MLELSLEIISVTCQKFTKTLPFTKFTFTSSYNILKNLGNYSVDIAEQTLIKTSRNLISMYSVNYDENSKNKIVKKM